MKNVFLFSGQGSQCEGMGRSLVESFPELSAIFDEASSVLGFDLYDKCVNAPAEELAKTVISQPAIMAVSLCAAEALRIKGIAADAVAGHSLGEYAAMVYAGIVTREDGFRLIKARSEAMQKAADASDGVMYAIVGRTADEVEKICAETNGYVVPVNYNATLQTVIAGDSEPCARAAEVFTEMGAKAVKLNVASAFHSKIMQPAADEFLPFAKTVKYSRPQITFMSNITGRAYDPDENVGIGDVPTDMADRLAMHIVSPVRFTDELNALAADGYDNFIECGPGKVLTGLVRKTLKGVTFANVQDADGLAKIV